MGGGGGGDKQASLFQGSVGIGCVGLVVAAREPFDVLAVVDQARRVVPPHARRRLRSCQGAPCVCGDRGSSMETRQGPATAWMRTAGRQRRCQRSLHSSALSSLLGPILGRSRRARHAASSWSPFAHQ